MRTIVVLERDYTVADEDMRDRYIGGSPCRSFDGARELVFAHHHSGCNWSISYMNNGMLYAEISQETGELVAEYFVQLVTDC